MKLLKPLILIATSFLVLLSSCGLFSAKTKEPASLLPEGYTPPVGVVEKVDTIGGYVFIRRYSALKLKNNDVIESRGDGRTANLFPTGEKLGERIAADIRSGDVQVGDVVYIRRAKTEDPSEAGEPEYELTP